jgi:hypothetical protein
VLGDPQDRSMSEQYLAPASHVLAGWTLRVEYEAVQWSEPLVPTLEPLPILAAYYEFEPESAPPAPDESGQAPADLGHANPPSEAGAGAAADAAPHDVPIVRPPSPDDAVTPVAARGTRYGLIVTATACALVAAVGWHFAENPGACWLPVADQTDMAGRLAADVVARRIVVAESGGDPSARNPRSSATGTGQFLDGTWLDMIRAYRPDLSARAEAEILDLRYDPDVSREMVARFAEKNAAMLGRRCLPVTPGTLYLSHFAGGAGAVAVLTAPDAADAAATMAEADSTGRTTREMIVTANPFLADFTVADLKRWADRKMGFDSGRRL